MAAGMKGDRGGLVQADDAGSILLLCSRLHAADYTSSCSNAWTQLVERILGSTHILAHLRTQTVQCHCRDFFQAQVLSSVLDRLKRLMLTLVLTSVEHQSFSWKCLIATFVCEALSATHIWFMETNMKAAHFLYMP